MRQVFQPGRTITKQFWESIAVYPGRRPALLFSFVFLWLAVGPGRLSAEPQNQVQTFDAKGAVIMVEPDGKTVVIHHDAISNYMGSMTMPFEVKDTNELRDLHPGDLVAFRLTVTPRAGWIEHIARLNQPSEKVPTPEAIHFAPAVDSLSEGDPVPNFRFTNELGHAIELRQFQGQTIALTFFFTSCPFPNFCPRLTANFAEAAAKLRQTPNILPWHLFSISFDPGKDTPSHLLAYATANHYDPAHWSFLTGDPAVISQFADLFDERYWNEGQTIGHNLRTVVIDPSGHLTKIFEGSSWSSEDLVSQILKATHPRPKSKDT